MTKRIKSLGTWRNNAEMIAEVVPLFVNKQASILEPTYGEGGFWKVWAPKNLVGCDIDPEKSPLGESVDYRDLPFKSKRFAAVVLDPPYKLNGTPTPEVDAPYGVDERATVSERWGNAEAGMAECVRVLKDDGYLFYKCQDQVVSGAVFFQVDLITELAHSLGLRKVDYAIFPSGREQPTHRWMNCDVCGGAGWREAHEGQEDWYECDVCGATGKVWKLSVQQHLDHNFSYLLVFKKTTKKRG